MMDKPSPIAGPSEDLVRAREVARDFASSVREGLGGRIERICLFGSAARGDWSAESDVDVLILLDQVNSEDTEWIVRKALATGLLAEGILIQPLILARGRFEELQRRERRLALEIEEQGIDL